MQDAEGLMDLGSDRARCDHSVLGELDKLDAELSVDASSLSEGSGFFDWIGVTHGSETRGHVRR